MDDSTGLAGRTVIVTGAAQGIGCGLAERVIALGGNVVAIDMNEDGLNALAQAHPGRLVSIAGDVSNPCSPPRPSNAPCRRSVVWTA